MHVDRSGQTYDCDAPDALVPEPGECDCRKCLAKYELCPDCHGTGLNPVGGERYVRCQHVEVMR